MNTLNFKDKKNKPEKNSLSQKNIHFEKFNKKLDDLMLDFQSKENNFNINTDILNNDKTMYNNNNNNNLIDIDNQIKVNDTNIDNYLLKNNNFEEKNQDNNSGTNLQKIRLNFENLMNSDTFGEYFDLIHSYESKMKFDENNNENFEIELPYSKPFNDKILLKDESIFFIFNNEFKYKFISQEDIQKMKTNKIELNFGKDPYETYGRISDGNSNERDTSQFYNSLNNFSIFKTKDPYYMNINMNNDYFNNNNNEQEASYIDATYDNVTITNNQIAQSIIINDKDNVFIFSNENEEQKQNENITDETYINRKRKHKKRKKNKNL